MVQRRFVSIGDAAELLAEKYDTIARRTLRLRQRDPDTELVRVEANADGTDRVVIDLQLVETWLARKSPTTRPHRDEADHLVVERDLLQQSLNHALIERDHLALELKNQEIAQLTTKLEAANALLESERQRTKTLAATLTTLTATISDMAG